MSADPTRSPDRRIVFGQPCFDEAEEQLLVKTLRSGWIGQGPLVQQFEQELAAYLAGDSGETPLVQAVSSCTAALHLALVAAGVGAGDEVITTPFTFVATINAIEHAGATPIMVDIDRASRSILPATVEQAITDRTKAIMPVHFAGQPLDLAGMYRIADEHDLWVIEDAAHAVGTIEHGRFVGNPRSTRGIVCFSFYPNKNLAAPEGGAVVTHNEQISHLVGQLRLHGLNTDAWKRFRTDTYTPSRAEHAGFKYNWTDIQAAVALPQLRKLEGFLARREQVASWYDEALRNIPGIETFDRVEPSDQYRHALHLYQIVVSADQRNRVLSELRARGIGAAVHYESVHRHPYYSERTTGTFPVSDWASDCLITLPLHVAMDHDDVEHVAHVLTELMSGERVDATSESHASTTSVGT